MAPSRVGEVERRDCRPFRFALVENEHRIAQAVRGTHRAFD